MAVSISGSVEFGLFHQYRAGTTIPFRICRRDSSKGWLPEESMCRGGRTPFFRFGDLRENRVS